MARYQNWMLDYQNLIQFSGAVSILLGYYYMSSNLKRSSAILVTGCILLTYWTTLIRPFPIWMFLLESVLAGFSIKTLYRYRKENW